MDVDNLTPEDLAKIVARYGTGEIVVCRHCKTITCDCNCPEYYDMHERERPDLRLKHYENYEKKYGSDDSYKIYTDYQPYCSNCSQRFPVCCVQRSMHSECYYEDHPQHVAVSKYGWKINLCRSCIKKKEMGKKRKKRDEEFECPCCRVPESDCKDVPFSRCKNCHQEVCKMCILNGWCGICYDEHRSVTEEPRRLQVGDRVIYSDCGSILTEATVKKIHKSKMGRKKIRILCDRDYDWNDPPKAINVYLKYLRKI